MKEILFVCRHWIKEMKKVLRPDEEICEIICPGTKKNCFDQPERLSEKTPKGDAIV